MATAYGGLIAAIRHGKESEKYPQKGSCGVRKCGKWRTKLEFSLRLEPFAEALQRWTRARAVSPRGRGAPRGFPRANFQYRRSLSPLREGSRA